MSITIPMWLIYTLGAVGVAGILFLAVMGLCFIVALKNFKLNW